MKRSLGLASLLFAAVLMLSGCQRTVEVEIGARTVCTYGHDMANEVRTVSVPAKDAASYASRTVTETCDLHATLEGLYQEAQDAIVAGDLKTAAAKLDEVLTGDPSFREAKRQADEIAAGKTPSPDGQQTADGGVQTGGTDPGQGGAVSNPATTVPTPGGQPSNPGEGDTSGPVGSLLPYAPDVIDGFTALKPFTDPVSITRDYRPEGSSKALTLVIAVTQYRSAAIADEVIKREVKPSYSVATSSEKAGKRTVSFGTSRQGYAAVWFNDKGILVVIEMAAKRGDDPKGLKSAVLKVASQIP